MAKKASTKNVDAFDEGVAPTAPSLATLMKLAEKAVAMEATVADLEEALEAQKSALHHLKTVELPDAMAEAGLSEFKTASKAEININDFVSGSLPKEPEARDRAIKQLVEEGGADIIKNVVSVQFTRSQHNEAAALAADLRDKGYESAKMASDVHPQTLMAFVREKLKKGEEVKYETLGCFVGRVAKIKLPKAAGSGDQPKA